MNSHADDSAPTDIDPLKAEYRYLPGHRLLLDRRCCHRSKQQGRTGCASRAVELSLMNRVVLTARADDGDLHELNPSSEARREYAAILAAGQRKSRELVRSDLSSDRLWTDLFGLRRLIVHSRERWRMWQRSGR